MSHMFAFREERPWHDDLPDEIIEQTLEYQIWDLVRQMRELFEANMVPFVSLLDWLERKLTK